MLPHKRQTKKKKRRKKAAKRIQMTMPPPFAHVSTDVKPEEVKIPWWKGGNVVVTHSVRMPKRVDKKILDPIDVQKEFDVAVYEGTSVEELKDYLFNGNVDFASWGEKTLGELQEQIDNGKCELGLGDDGNCLRVASIVKVFFYDEHNDLLLLNPVNSYESHRFVGAIRKSSASNLSRFQNIVSQTLGLKGNQVEVDSYSREMYEQSRKKSENVEIPSSFIFETTFSPFKETPRDAAARVVAWRFSLSDVTGKIFYKKYPMKIKNYESSHFPGLKSEYQVHHVKINPEFIVPLQKAMPTNTVTAMCLNSATNTGVNTHWYCWIKATDSAEAMIDNFSKIYDTNPKLQNLLGVTDFSGDTAQAIGVFMKEEAELLSVWN